VQGGHDSPLTQNPGRREPKPLQTARRHGGASSTTALRKDFAELLK
jgi:hypothetical protein